MNKGLTRELICLRASQEARPGDYVNLGIGMPAEVANFISEDVILHTENGALGFGGIAIDESERDIDLVNAGGEPITMKPGIAFMDSMDAFDMIRGGRIDLTIMGAYQVSKRGDLAGIAVPEEPLPRPGGSMDLVIGAKRLIVVMEHIDRQGNPKVVTQCTYPLSAKGVVSRIITSLAVIDVSPQGLILVELPPGVSVDEVQANTEPKLIISPALKEMKL